MSYIYHSGTPKTTRATGATGRKGAAAAAIVLVADWLVNGYPNLENFGLMRFIEDSIRSSDPPTVYAVLALVVVPTLLLSSAAWLSGRLVAGRYAREAGEVGSGGQAPVRDPRPDTG